MNTEALPLFPVHSRAMFAGEECYIISVKTYCPACESFLKEPTYSVKTTGGTITRDVEEDWLSFVGASA